jgi:hypothetical protein
MSVSLSLIPCCLLWVYESVFNHFCVWACLFIPVSLGPCVSLSLLCFWLRGHLLGLETSHPKARIGRSQGEAARKTERDRTAVTLGSREQARGGWGGIVGATAGASDQYSI